MCTTVHPFLACGYDELRLPGQTAVRGVPSSCFLHLPNRLVTTGAASRKLSLSKSWLGKWTPPPPHCTLIWGRSLLFAGRPGPQEGLGAAAEEGQ